MRAQPLALRRLDRAWRLVEKLAEELPERALADEADSGAIRLVEDGESGAASTLADFALLEVSEWHEGGGEVFGGYRMQEVALVFRAVAGLVESCGSVIGL